MLCLLEHRHSMILYPKVKGENNFWGVLIWLNITIYLAKLKMVKEYLEGSIGMLVLSRKYRMPSDSLLRIWIYAYQEFGPETITRKKLKRIILPNLNSMYYTFKKQTGASYRDTRIHFKIHNSTLIAN